MGHQGTNKPYLLADTKRNPSAKDLLMLVCRAGHTQPRNMSTGIYMAWGYTVREHLQPGYSWTGNTYPNVETRLRYTWLRGVWPRNAQSR